MIRLTKIVTKTGDRGITTLDGKRKIPKWDLTINTIGDVDETNSWIGLIDSTLLPSDADSVSLKQIQRHLYDIGASLADSLNKEKPSLLEESAILYLEERVKNLNPTLPELTSFILPGGSLCSSYCHLARTVCRRAERNFWDSQARSFEKDLSLCGIYLNRLSDFLFVFARFYNKNEKLWRTS